MLYVDDVNYTTRKKEYGMQMLDNRVNCRFKKNQESLFVFLLD